MLIDSHAHLTDPRFEGEVEEVLARARGAGVDAVITIASDLADSRAVLALAGRFPSLYAAIGVHPHAAASADERTIPELRELAADPRVVALGETGLDFYYEHAPRAVQQELFRQHLELGAELDLPVVVHARDADAEVAGAIREVGWTRGVLHCFDGGPELLAAALELGWYISFSGLITFGRWQGAELLRQLPADRLLVETDSPYLAPVPLRGRRNEPSFLPHTAERMAAVRGTDVPELARTLARNTRSCFRIEDPA